MAKPLVLWIDGATRGDVVVRIIIAMSWQRRQTTFTRCNGTFTDDVGENFVHAL